MRFLHWLGGLAFYSCTLALHAAVPPPPPPTAADLKALSSVDVLTAAQKAGVLRVATEPDFPPLYWMDESGKPRGFEYDLARKIALDLGIPKIEIKEADYNQLPELTRQGKADIFMAGYVADASIPGVEWSNGYLDFGLCLITPKGSPIKNTKQLKGKRIGVYEDPAAIRWVKNNVPDYKELRTYMGPGWLYHVDARDVDVAIYDYPLTPTELKKFPRLQVASYNLNENNYVIGFKSGNTNLKDAVNKAIDHIKITKDYAELIKTYMPAHISDEVPADSTTYIVQNGDQLTSIAAKQLGSTAEWKTIWELNKDRLPNPNLLEQGDILVMPKLKKDNT